MVSLLSIIFLNRQAREEGQDISKVAKVFSWRFINCLVIVIDTI
jgi:hypothetical protein